MTSPPCPYPRAARLLVLLLALAPLRSPQAQDMNTVNADTSVTFSGMVRDTSGRPLSGAEVRAGLRFTLTGDDGAFVLGGLSPDSVQLLVRRIGYQPVDVTLAVTPGTRAELAIRLTPAAVELGTIVIEGQRMDTRLWRTGFYHREKLGFGTFFNPARLEHHGGSLDGLVREVPGVRVERDGSGRARALGPGLCNLNVFLDGLLIRWAGEVGLDQLVDKRELLAVEVYPRATDVPTRLAGNTSGTEGSGGLPSPGGGVASQARGVGNVDCGALALWTKPIGDKRSARASRPDPEPTVRPIPEPRRTLPMPRPGSRRPPT